jgi:hypothetical protein
MKDSRKRVAIKEMADKKNRKIKRKSPLKTKSFTA